MNMSYGLTFDSGKLWVAEQLDSIATRYLNRSARLVAQHVRHSISYSESLKLGASMRTPSPIASNQDDLVPNVETWSSSSDEVPYQTYMTEGQVETSTSAATATTTSDSGVQPVEDVFQDDPRVWDRLP